MSHKATTPDGEIRFESLTIREAPCYLVLQCLSLAETLEIISPENFVKRE
jgi:hypothetical protein